jgi:hypothetical protein
LTSGTAYTFQVRASNATGNSAYSAASNSVTPVVPSSYESIATATPTSGSSITFSSIPATYKSLQIRYSVISLSASGFIQMRLNTDTGSNYNWHYLNGNNTVASAGNSAGSSTIMRLFGNVSGTVTTYPNVGIVDILDYESTTKNKTIRAITGADNNTTTDGEIYLSSGLWRNTAAVTDVTLLIGSGFLTGSTIALYGIK